MDDDLNGYGRKRRSMPSEENKAANNNTEDFPRTLVFKVVAPGFATTRVKNTELSEYEGGIFEKKGIDGKCKQVIYSIASLSLLFCFIVTLSASIAICNSKRRNLK